MQQNHGMYWLTATAISATIAFGSGICAASGAENDALAAPPTKIGLSQAVGVAEQDAAGKAVRAELEKSKGGQWVYDVEVVNGKKVMDVKVDPDSGKVLAATADQTDHDDGQDKED